MTIAERHIRKFRAVLKAEGFSATQRFELVGAAWAQSKHFLSQSLHWCEKNLATLERMYEITRVAKPFHLSDNGTDFWFTYNGSSRAHYYSRIDSRRGISVAIFKLVNDTPDEDAETLLSNYVFADETVACEITATFRAGDPVQQFGEFAKALEGAKIAGVIEVPRGVGVELALIKDGKPYLLDSLNISGKPKFELAQIFPL